MKEVFDEYVQSTLISDRPTDYSLRVYETNYRKLLPESRTARILDIGVGVGGLLQFVKELGYANAKGIDISPSTIASCRKKGLDCELVDNTPDWLNAHPAAFDFITLLDVIEHIPKKELIGFLSAIRRSLGDAGTLLLQTNNMQAADAQLMRYGDITHEVGFCETSLRQVCRVAGFGSIEIFGLEPLYACRSWRHVKQMPVKAAQHFACGIVRNCIWWIVRKMRRLNCNVSPEILHPIFYAVVRK